jgi:hypothetical protein
LWEITQAARLGLPWQSTVEPVFQVRLAAVQDLYPLVVAVVAVADQLFYYKITYYKV